MEVSVANSVRNICRMAKKRWKIIPNSAVEPGPVRWRHNCGEITSEKTAVLLHHLKMETRGLVRRKTDCGQHMLKR